MKHFLILVAVVAFFSCKKDSYSEAYVQPEPKPGPPEMVELFEEATHNGDSIKNYTGSINTSFITIGLGRGFGLYQIIFFKDSLLQDTVQLEDQDTQYQNNMSLRVTVNADITTDTGLFQEGTYYWHVLYWGRLIRSETRKVYIKED